MARPLPDLSRLRPAGGKHSIKRDRILSTFLRQEGHSSADDLFDLVRRQDAGIGRATDVRTLQWMVEAGCAQGGFRRRARALSPHAAPARFHLICAVPRVIRVSQLGRRGHGRNRGGAQFHRHADARPDSRRVRGVPVRADASTAAGAIGGSTTELVFARDALRIAIATERSGLEFYTRAANLTQDPRGRTVFKKLAVEEREHLSTLETRYRDLIAQDPQLESRPTFLFFKGAASGLFAEGAKKLGIVVDDQQALLIGIKCERGSHKFFKRYGRRFETPRASRSSSSSPTKSAPTSIC